MYCQHCGKFTENVDGVCETCRDTLEATNEMIKESRDLADNTQEPKVMIVEKQEEKEVTEEEITKKELTEEILSAKQEIFVETQESVIEEKLSENESSKEEEKQGENNTSLKKALSPSLKNFQLFGIQKLNDFVKGTGKEMISVSTIKESAFLLVATLILSTLLSVVIAIIANLILKNQINLLWGQMVGSYVEDSKGGFLTFYRLLRMSYLHTLRLSVSTMGGSVVLGMNVHILILTLIPFASMFIAWKLLSHQSIRSSLKFLFSEEPVFKTKKVLPITLNFSLVLAILYFATSFIRVNVAKNELFAMKLSYGALSSIFGTILVTLISCYIITGILKLRDRKILTAGSVLWSLKQYYMKYSIGVIVVSILITLITVIRSNMWKQIGTVLLSLPNIFLIAANSLSFGGIQTINRGEVDTLRSSLSGVQVVCSILLALTWCIFLWYLLYQTYLKFDKSNKKNYIINVGILSGIILVIQFAFYYISKVSISLSMLGEAEVGVGIKVNILLSLFVLVLVSVGAAACAYYFPNLFYKKGSKEEVLLVGTWKHLNMSVLIALSILVCLTFLVMTKKQSGSVESGSFTGKENYSKEEAYTMIDPENIDVFSEGFVFRDYSRIYAYQKGKVKKISLDEESYFSDSDYHFSKTSERILKVSQNSAMLLDSKGKELYKQKVSFDQLLCATTEFDKLVFLVDGDVTLYDKKENNFTVLDGITNYEYADFYFDESDENLYLVDSSIRSYNLKSKTMEVVKEQTPEFILDSKDDFTAKLYLVDAGKLVSPVGDTKIRYYVRNMIREYESYCVIIENGKESPVPLPDMVSAEAINREGTKFLVTFTEYGDYYLYDAEKAELTNISTQIRYLTSNKKVEG